MSIRVAVNGYGVIGGRVADAGQELLYAYQVDNQTIAVPETIDAIRALMGTERDASRSIRMTNDALGIRQAFP